MVVRNISQWCANSKFIGRRNTRCCTLHFREVRYLLANKNITLFLSVVIDWEVGRKWNGPAHLKSQQQIFEDIVRVERQEIYRKKRKVKSPYKYTRVPSSFIWIRGCSLSHPCGRPKKALTNFSQAWLICLSAFK